MGYLVYVKRADKHSPVLIYIRGEDDFAKNYIPISTTHINC